MAPSSRPGFRHASHVAPDAITAAADLAAVVYYAVDLWGHTMDAATLALWQEAAAISRRIHADARRHGGHCTGCGRSAAVCRAEAPGAQ
jgi:hypothetical protein